MLVTFLFVAIIAKLIYTQIVNAESLQIMALDQWTRDVPITGERGDIFDKNGTLLADTETIYTVYVRPVSVSNKEYTANLLAKVLNKNNQDLLVKINSKVSEITVSKKVSKQEMVALTQSGVTGVYFSQNLNRRYIYGDFMTQILGFVNVDGMGQSGVESYYNNYLKGVDGYILTETDLVGRELDTNVTRYISGKKGNSVYLTLDYAISSIVENAVSVAYQKYNATNASCVVMNVKTGEIVAMAQQPSYDLNNLPRNDIALLFDRSKSLLVSNVYEPGSTFKILTAAIGLNSGVIDTNYHFYCPGYKIVDGKKIKCWKTTGHGSQDFVEGVQNSCNVLFMDIALKIGAERFYQEIDKFGLNSKTGIDMSGEASGLVIDKNVVKTVDLARMGFGQAIAMTPIELLTACAAVVNGGNLMKPYIVDKIVDREGKIIMSNYPSIQRKVISEETSELMREILESVVSDGGGKNAQVSGYRIGGKTGTAQKYKNGVIAQGLYVSTFIGFAPANDPEYMLLFIVDEPKGGVYYGSMVAAPYTSEIFANIFNYKGWESSEVNKKPAFEMPNLEGMSISNAYATLKKAGIYYEVAGEGGKVIGQLPVAGSMVTTDISAVIIIG